MTMFNPRGADPETVIRQTLRAQAGGPRGGGPVRDGASRGEPSRRGPRSSLTVSQVLLIVAIIGLLIGMAAGFTVLLLDR